MTFTVNLRVLSTIEKVVLFFLPGIEKVILLPVVEMVASSINRYKLLLASQITVRSYFKENQTQ